MNNDQQAQRDKIRKIQLENALLISLLSWLNTQTKLIRLYYGQIQQLYHLNDSKGSLEKILKNHYVRVQSYFIRNELNRLNITLNKEEWDKLIDLLNQKAISRSISQSGYIIQTLQKQLDHFGISQLKVWQQQIRRHFKGIVINTETNSVAEETKTEVVNFLLNEGKLNGISVIVRTWWTVEDDRVRETHRLAHGQERSFGSSFLVGGEWLKYPGDLAGSPANIINCRCTLLTDVIS